LENIIGERGMKVILFHIESVEYLDDPTVLHRHLYAIFGVGAECLEKLIVKKLFQRLNLSFEENGTFDFGKFVEQARELFIARMKSWKNMK
jgi:hypothetical protein